MDRRRRTLERHPARRSSRELLEKLQAAYPGEYPDNLLRTVQRRVKVWRKEKALSMVFGNLPEEESLVGEASGH